MSNKLGIIMDPIQSIKPHKDTNLALLLEAQQRGYELYYIEPQNLFLQQTNVHATTQQLTVFDDNTHWFELQDESTITLSELDLILMRLEPPVDMNFIYVTYLLELAERKGAHIINRPSSIRSANEKLFTAWFPQCMPETFVGSQYELLKNFIETQQEVILKPLNGMGGQGVFHLKTGDPNTNVTLELLTHNQTTPIMAQRYLPDVRDGDKRILLINGEPVDSALARIPQSGESRANLAAGGTGEARPLTERDHWLCQQVGPTLKELGLLFVGLDVIGDYITEINVTCPTCVRELDQLTGATICKQFFDSI